MFSNYISGEIVFCFTMNFQELPVFNQKFDGIIILRLAGKSSSIAI